MHQACAWTHHEPSLSHHDEALGSTVLPSKSLFGSMRPTSKRHSCATAVIASLGRGGQRGAGKRLQRKRARTRAPARRSTRAAPLAPQPPTARVCLTGECRRERGGGGGGGGGGAAVTSSCARVCAIRLLSTWTNRLTSRQEAGQLSERPNCPGHTSDQSDASALQGRAGNTRSMALLQSPSCSRARGGCAHLGRGR